MTLLLNFLYGSFPREVGIDKHRIVHTWDEFVNYINTVNGHIKMPAVSLYSFDGYTPDGELDHSQAGIDKLLYDWDFNNSEGYDALIEARKLDAELNKADWKHFIEMSGGGIHIIPFLDIIKYDHPNSTIANFREYLLDNGFKFDSSVVAGTAQMIRILGTYNLKRKKFCIPITSTELQLMTQQELQDFAKVPRQINNINDFLSGNKLKTLKKFDVQRAGYDGQDDKMPNFGDVGITPVRAEDIYNCCHIPADANNQQRYILITSLIEQGYNQVSIELYLEKFMSQLKFVHCVKEEVQVKRLCDQGVVLHSCDKLLNMQIARQEQCINCRRER